MISVCLATYNGEKYIQEQLSSILCQLGEYDEVVISDDGSTDETISILERFMDPRVRIYRNPDRLGHVRNFEVALSLSRGDYIFLSDQDDVWVSGRVNKMLEQIGRDSKSLLVASNFDLIDAEGAVIGEFRALGCAKKSRLAQIISIFVGKSPYFGCTFLLKRAALKYCLPIPKNIESHDIWIALVMSALGCVVNMLEPTLRHRVHGGNVTAKKRRALIVVLKSRFFFAKALVSRLLWLSINT